MSGAEQKGVFKTGSSAQKHQLLNNLNSNIESKGVQEQFGSHQSRLITADELDVTVAKHPASLTARFLLIQQALAQVR